MASSIDALLSAIIQERKKAKSDEDDDFVLVQDIDSHWPDLFDTFFLSKATRLAPISNSTTHDDDLIFYVARRKDDEEETIDRSQLVQVFRHHDVKRQPKLASPLFDWEDTTYLNLILHQFDYIVTAAICIKEDKKELKPLKTASTRVYASPSRRNMRSKGTEEKISYPDIYFTVDNYEDNFCELYVNEGQMVCVELLAVNPDLSSAKVLFLGSIKYELLKSIYDERAQTSDRVTQRMTLGMFSKTRVEFVRMRGPNKKGHAEMTVSEVRSMKSDGPSSQSNPSSPVTVKPDENNINKSQTIDHLASLPSKSSETEEDNEDKPKSNATTEEFAEESAGLFGRRFSQAINWVRGSASRLNATSKSIPLQTCLTYINLPCHSIIRDILQSTTKPLLCRNDKITKENPQ